VLLADVLAAWGQRARTQADSRPRAWEDIPEAQGVVPSPSHYVLAVRGHRQVQHSVGVGAKNKYSRRDNKIRKVHRRQIDHNHSQNTTFRQGN
jgi:hypothetical protein